MKCSRCRNDANAYVPMSATHNHELMCSQCLASHPQAMARAVVVGTGVTTVMREQILEAMLRVGRRN